VKLLLGSLDFRAPALAHSATAFPEALIEQLPCYVSPKEQNISALCSIYAL
jgi:hypothetical protein